MIVKNYADLRRLKTFDDRFKYLRIGGSVGASTFGFDRAFNQRFYTSREWKQIRNSIIVRDNGCDLGIEGFDIFDKIYIHHMNPMTIQDIERGGDFILDPNYLISVAHTTHNAIHFGNSSTLKIIPDKRRPGDTRLWSKSRI